MRADLGIALAVVGTTMGTASPLRAQNVTAPQAPLPPLDVQDAGTPQPLPLQLGRQDTTPPQPLPAPLPSSAHASPSLLPATDARFEQALVLDGWIGGGTASVVDGSSIGFLVFGFDLLYYYRYFEIGAGTNLQIQPLGDVGALVGGLVGVKLEPTPRMRLDLLAETGFYHVSFTGLLQTAESGGSAALPYIGGRIGTSLLRGRSRRFLMGFWVSAGETIGRITVNSVFQDCLFSCATVQQTDTIGGGIVSIGLRIGGDIAGRH